MVLLTACGGGKQAEAVEPLPDVVGKRLDIALSDLKQIGLERGPRASGDGENTQGEVEIVGGGTFGVLDESGWTVCDQDPDAGTRSKTARLLVDRQCAAEDSFEAKASPGAEQATTAPAQATQAPSKAVPNVVGQDLQGAQDFLQSQGFFNLTSHDASGQNRQQVLDLNWQVCDQTPVAGTVVPTDSQIDLGAVKDEEECPVGHYAGTDAERAA